MFITRNFVLSLSKLLLIFLLLFLVNDSFSQGKVLIKDATNQILMEIREDGVIIKKLTTSEREAAASYLTADENGILVYDTEKKSFWSWEDTKWSEIGRDDQVLDFSTTNDTLFISKGNWVIVPGLSDANATCSDGAMNGDEQGVDCGGSNCPICPELDPFTPYVADDNTIALFHFDLNDANDLGTNGILSNPNIFGEVMRTNQNTVNLGMSSSSKGNSGRVLTDAMHSISQSKFGGASIEFNGGSQSFVEILHNTEYSEAAASGPITIEFWTKPTDLLGDGVFLSKSTDFRDNYFYIGQNGTNVELTLSDQGNFMVPTTNDFDNASLTTYVTTSNPLVIDDWNHIAVILDPSNGAKLFINGNHHTITGLSTNVYTIDRNFESWLIGAKSQDGGAGGVCAVIGIERDFIGYLDELRISKIARYSGSFVPSSTAFTTDINTLGLWHMDLSNGVMDDLIYDEAEVIQDIAGIAHNQKSFSIDNECFRWHDGIIDGPPSVPFPGFGAYAYTSEHARARIIHNNDFESQNITVEFWMHYTDLSYSGFLFEKGDDFNAGNTSLEFTGNAIDFKFMDNALNQQTLTSPVLAADTWHHVAAVIDGTNGIISLYINKNLEASLNIGNVDPGWSNNISDIYIASSEFEINDGAENVVIDELRISSINRQY